MRKIVFLFFVLAFAVVGLSWADGGMAHPPGVLTLEAGLFEHGGQGAAIALNTVSVGELPVIRHGRRSAELLAFPETIERAGEPRWIGHGWTSASHKPGYWLRL